MEINALITNPEIHTINIKKFVKIANDNCFDDDVYLFILDNLDFLIQEYFKIAHNWLLEDDAVITYDVDELLSQIKKELNYE